MPIIQNQPANNLDPLSLVKTAQDLQQSLSQIAPDESKTTKIITFALVATAMVGMFMYHYVKSQEETN